MKENDKKSRSGFTRRGVLGAGVAGGAVVAAQPTRAATKTRTMGPARASITIEVNGKQQRLSVEPRVTLLRALRNQLDLTGTKEVCNGGACGACSVLLDGQLVNSCMLLAVDAAGRKVTTIEGVSPAGKMNPLQEAFVKFDALQCGFCTPGMVMACKALLDANKSPDLHQIKRALCGNICRCGTYPRIFAAVQAVSKQA